MTLAFMPLLAVPSKAVSTEIDDIALGALESFDPGSVFRFTGPDVIRLVVVEGDVVDSGGVDNGVIFGHRSRSVDARGVNCCNMLSHASEAVAHELASRTSDEVLQDVRRDFKRLRFHQNRFRLGLERVEDGLGLQLLEGGRRYRRLFRDFQISL